MKKQTKKPKPPVVKAGTDPITPVPDKDGNCGEGWTNINGVCVVNS